MAELLPESCCDVCGRMVPTYDLRDSARPPMPGSGYLRLIPHRGRSRSHHYVDTDTCVGTDGVTTGLTEMADGPSFRRLIEQAKARQAEAAASTHGGERS